MALSKSLIVRSGIMTSFCSMVVTPSLDLTLIVIVNDGCKKVSELVPNLAKQKKSANGRKVLGRRQSKSHSRGHFIGGKIHVRTQPGYTWCSIVTNCD